VGIVAMTIGGVGGLSTRYSAPDIPITAALVVAVVAAAGFAGFGAGGTSRGSPTGAADTPAPGASVRDTSPFNGSPDAALAGLSAAAFAGVAGGGGGSGLLGSSAI
jgi:hypothetical protein